MKYYLIAGEASGDLHGSHLIKALKTQDEAAEFRFWGGEKMEAIAGQLVKHYKDLAFMGFWEVIKNLLTILRNLSFCKKDILAFQPDVLVLIDYPGFNLRIAKFAHRHGIKVAYYISPQVWAWKASRVKTIKRVVDEMIVILPFEPAFYQEWNYEVSYVGHPLLDSISIPPKRTDQRHIVLLPGSRQQEIKKILPLMLQVAATYPTYSFKIGGLSHLGMAFYQSFDLPKNVSVKMDQPYQLLESAEAAIVTSGTATLETALHQVPQVVVYKGSWLSYQIGRRLVKVKFISLVNLIMDRLVVRELIQNDCSVSNVKSELDSLLESGEKRQMMLDDYTELRTKLGGGGAATRAAQKIGDLLSSQL